MRIETATEKDIAVGLEPCSPPVVAVKVTDSSTLRVEFADGVVGDVRLLPSHMTGVFEPLKVFGFLRRLGWSTEQLHGQASLI